MLNEARIECALGGELGFPVAVAVASEPIDVEALTGAELRRYAELARTPRCDSWLRGRAALKRLLPGIGTTTDTAALVFPHPRLSLTHCGRYAVAIAVFKGCLSGIGVDLELRPSLPEKAARFFLSSDERKQLRHPLGAALLRLWTVKEAVFKADHDNPGRGLLDYEVVDPSALSGEARVLADALRRVRYTSLPVGDGFLTAAVARSAWEQQSACPELVEGPVVRQAHRERAWL